MTNIGDEGLAHIGVLSSLKALNVAQTGITDAGLVHLANLSELERLSLQNNSITNKGLIELRGLKNLKHLTLRNTKITDEGLFHLNKLKLLKSLTLSDTDIKGHGLLQLRDLSSLEWLWLGSTSIKDSILMHIGTMKKLKGLYLNETQITDTGIGFLKNLDQLEQLVLAETKITDKGLEHLAGLSNLKSLNLKKTSVSKNALKTLMQALPNCNIMHSEMQSLKIPVLIDQLGDKDPMKRSFALNGLKRIGKPAVGALIEVEKNKKENLQTAIAGGDIDEVKKLVEEGADVNMKGREGRTPMRWAVDAGHKEIVELLIRNGANVNVPDDYGAMLLYITGTKPKAETAKYLEIAGILIVNGADVNANKNRANRTPLHACARYGREEIAELLIANGAIVDAKDIHGKTPLLLAASVHKEVSELLVKSGADIAAKDKDGQTPLHLAANWGHVDIVKLFLDRGADINAKDSKGLTPLNYATRKKYRDVIKLLEANGGYSVTELKKPTLKMVFLPDVDDNAVMLDLASGQLVGVPEPVTGTEVMAAIDKLDKGDIIFDSRALIFVRGAFSNSSNPHSMVESVKMYRIPNDELLPKKIIVTTRSGKEYEFEILEVIKQGCRINYYYLVKNAVQVEGEREISEADKMASENFASEGWQLGRQRKLAEAEKMFKRAVEKDPANANAWNGLGWSQFNQGKPRNARVSFEKCLQINSKHSAALNGLGWIAKGRDKTDEAIGHWEKAVEAAPTATAALNGLATTYLELKRYDKAAKYYQMWLDVEPDNADAKAGLEKARAQELSMPKETVDSKPDEREVEQAVDAAEIWLKLVDDGDYGKSWDEAAGYFKKAVSKDQWQSSLAAVRVPLGKVISREVKSKRYTKQLPGAPDGEYVVIEFDTSFENKSSAIETVTPMLDKDGLWRVSGYYIK